METLPEKNIIWEETPGNLLSPSSYFRSLVLPFIESDDRFLHVSGFLNGESDEKPTDNTSVILSFEDRPDFSELLTVQNLSSNSSVPSDIHVIFHDSTFFESNRVADWISSGLISSCSTPWEEISYVIRDTYRISVQSGVTPYPWIPESLQLTSDSFTGDDPNILLHMRGVREGRLHIVGKVLRQLGIVEKAVLLVEEERTDEFRKALLMLELEELRIINTLTAEQLSSLFRNAKCFINPLFSSYRPLSHLMMEAFHKQVPVLLTDFGPARMLPEQVRKYQPGVNEEKELTLKLEQILSEKINSETEQSLHEYALEYGDPACIARELKFVI